MTAAEDETGDADGGAGAARYRAALPGERAVDVDELGARADHPVRRRVTEAVERGDVDDEPAIAAGPTGIGMAAVADRDGRAVRPGEGQALADVVLAGDVRDGRRLQVVEACVVELAGRRVVAVPRPYEPAVQPRGERVPARWGGGAGGGRAVTRRRGRLVRGGARWAW